MDELVQQLIAFAQVVVINVVLSGDNAIVVGLAASRIPAARRAQVIMWGTVGAVVLRVIFAAAATQLLAVVGLTLAGGVLLLWVCWKLWQELRKVDAAEPALAGAGHGGAPGSSHDQMMTMRAAITTIVVADLSMSLDNILAVAGASRGDMTVMAVGLGLSIVLMAIAANYIANLLVRFPWISWLGLAIILYVAGDMILRGTHEVAHATGTASWLPQPEQALSALLAMRR